MSKTADAVRVLGAIARACYALPNMRVGQIIDNAITAFQAEFRAEYGEPELYYVEDDVLVKALDWYVARFSTLSKELTKEES